MSNQNSKISVLKSFFIENQERIMFFIILVLIALLSFRAGQLKEREVKSSQVNVYLEKNEKLSDDEKKSIALGEAIQRKGLEAEVRGEAGSKEVPADKKKCQFVGSKNSDKYHLASCGWAERIKPENRVCFDSIEKALEMGYKAAACCSD